MLGINIAALDKFSNINLKVIFNSIFLVSTQVTNIDCIYPPLRVITIEERT